MITKCRFANEAHPTEIIKADRATQIVVLSSNTNNKYSRNTTEMMRRVVPSQMSRQLYTGNRGETIYSWQRHGSLIAMC